MSIVDLRSDTVTRPTPGMRQAIADAPVGDDVLGDDPTVLRLQERVATLVGKQAALFVPSGSMANQVAIRAVCEPGDELIIDQTTHSYNYETAGPAALSGVSMRLIDGSRGIFDGQDVDSMVRARSSHFPNSRMVIVENTNNRGGGSVWPIEKIARVREAARRHDLWLHIDGARLWNASCATGRPLHEYAGYADSLSMCFSKGLGAPIGSIVAGSTPFIARCHRFRKMFGGGMRQVGILAAAAEYALDHHLERLREDHQNARRLADAIAALPGIRLSPADVETNIVIFGLAPALCPAADFVQQLGTRGVRMLATATDKVRAVTHLDVSAAQIDQAVAAMREMTPALVASRG